MGKKTGIEWTDATWNPVRGCSRVSEGCRNCYAERVAARFSGPGAPYEGLAGKVGGEPRWTGKVQLAMKQLHEPLRWGRNRRIFVNSMSDLFHENLPNEIIDEVFAVMGIATFHTYQVLTKRPERMRDYMMDAGTPRRVWQIMQQLAPDFVDAWCDGFVMLPTTLRWWDYFLKTGELPTQAIDEHIGWPFRNVWLGVSVENQATADERMPMLLSALAAKRFVSCEPLLGPVDLLSGAGTVDWVIAGGESGPKARPSQPAWYRSLRDQCAAAGVPFFFKQWGEFAPDGDGDTMHRVGKKQAGHTLDGVIHHEFPA